jgi:hypothetical protein
MTDTVVTRFLLPKYPETAIMVGDLVTTTEFTPEIEGALVSKKYVDDIADAIALKTSSSPCQLGAKFGNFAAPQNLTGMYVILGHIVHVSFAGRMSGSNTAAIPGPPVSMFEIYNVPPPGMPLHVSTVMGGISVTYKFNGSVGTRDMWVNWTLIRTGTGEWSVSGESSTGASMGVLPTAEIGTFTYDVFLSFSFPLY